MRHPLPLVAALLAVTTLPAAESMLGRQSQNEGLTALQAVRPVAVDGDLSDWDWSSRIWCFADIGVRNRYSAEVAAQWDAEALYLAVKWRDPTPMHSVVDPMHTPQDGWKSDALQLRVRSADQAAWITTWYFTAARQPVVDIARWKDAGNQRKGMESGLLLRAAPGGTDLGQGVRSAYRADADGKGYVQELRLPWALLYRTPPAAAPGQALRVGFEFLWGDPSGGLQYPVHRYADNLQPGETSREFFWTAQQAWGDVRLAGPGPVAQRRYVPDGGRVQGAVPVRAVLPEGAGRFTLVIDDAAGNRVRNLVGDADPALYQVEGAPTGTVEVGWDGCDDRGRPVAAGAYRARGLSHPGLGVEYEQCFYNPGTPPWATVDGRGAWGADHHPPCAVAAGPGTTVVAWPFAEGGHGLIGIGADGRKRWSQYRGASLVAVDGGLVYAFQDLSWHTAGKRADFLCRYSLEDGTPRLFTVDGRERPLDLPLHQVLGRSEPVRMRGLAAAGGRLAASFEHGEVVVFTTADLGIAARIPVAAPGPLAWMPDGTLRVVTGMGSGGGIDAGSHDDDAPAHGTGVVRIDPASGRVEPLALAGLVAPSALAVDRTGDLLVADAGPDSQVKAYGADGRLRRALGRQGGRPLRGVFDPQAMVRMSAVAVDDQGLTWVTERWDYPRRVSVWRQDGTLERDYIGNTGYSGVGTYLHDQRPGLAYCGPIEMALDPATRSYRVTRILWVPDAAKGERFPIPLASNAYPSRFTAAPAGQSHEYLYWRGENGPHVVFTERNGDWKPAAAVCLVGHLVNGMGHRLHAGPAATGEWAGLDDGDGCFWNDANRDGIPQRSECVIVPTAKRQTKPGQRVVPAIAISSGWGGRMGGDLSFACVDAQGRLVRYRPMRIDADGVPVYGPEGMALMAEGLAGASDTLPLPEAGTVVAMGANHGGPDKPFVGLDAATGAVRWSYPNRYAGVHGSHAAPMPKAGELIGPLKICGSADLGRDIGPVFLVRGNLGQDFLFTADGLHVGALFTDCRLPREALPGREADLVGRPMEGFSQGSEPFNGWFGRQADGVVRQVCGMPGQAGMVQRIQGLDGIRRIAPVAVPLDEATVARAALRRAESAAAAAAQAKDGRIGRLARTPAGDGSGWEGIRQALAVSREGQPESAQVRLARDDRRLWVRWEVKDATPWRNGGDDAGRLFKTGDAVDLCLRTDPAATGAQPVAGDLRVVVAPMAGRPVAVLMRPVDPGAPADAGRTYTSPVGTKAFARVQILAEAELSVAMVPGGYRIEAGLPFTALGWTPTAGQVLSGDVGILCCESTGTVTTARVCWSNQDTNLVSDLPLEAWLFPARWGRLQVE